jgi:hypothetical protein
MHRLEERHHANNYIFSKSFNIRVMMSQHCFNSRGLAISTSYPDYFRRKPKQHTQVAEICILRDDQKVFTTRMFPNLFIIRLVSPSR